MAGNAVDSSGIEEIRGSYLDDVLRGSRGADRFSPQAGSYLVNAGRGRDRFVFAEGDGSDVIADFRDGADRIEIHGEGGFRALEITRQGADTVLEFADVAITLLDVDRSSLGAADFIFV